MAFSLILKMLWRLVYQLVVKRPWHKEIMKLRMKTDLDTERITRLWSSVMPEKGRDAKTVQDEAQHTQSQVDRCNEQRCAFDHRYKV